jgi:hypothetical protein
MAVVKKATTGKRTLLIEGHNGKFRITIPADWKVTFGAFQQGGGNKYDTGDRSAALRIYESESMQRACFRDVRSFRDLSIPLEKLVIAKTGEESWEDDGEGNASSKHKTTAKKEWKSD